MRPPSPPRPSARRLVVVLGAVLALAGLGACEASVEGPATTGPVAATTRPEPPARTAPGSPDPAGSEPAGVVEPATVLRVVDGDTIVVDRGLGPERLRYIGIDAPESVRPGTPVEFMGREASAANAALVEGREVVLERDVSDRDRFDRLLRYVWLRRGEGWLLVNRELVRTGFANAAAFPPDVRRMDELRAAERAAREAGVGLWGSPAPSP